VSSRLLPPNATAAERALAETVGRVSDIPVPVGDSWDPQTCPAALLPWLAWALSVDLWGASWSDAIKRQVIAEMMTLHRHRGTPWAVERALIITGAPNARVSEWFEYGGVPYRFKVLVDVAGSDISPDLENSIMHTIDRYKNQRSWLDAIEYSLATEGQVPVLTLGVQFSEVITVYPL